MNERQELLNCSITIAYLEDLSKGMLKTEVDTFLKKEISRLENRKEEILKNRKKQKEKEKAKRT